MKKLFVFAIVLSVISCTTSPKSVQNVVDSGDMDELTNIQKNQFVKAYLEQDSILLEGLLHDDYQLIDDNGDRYNKQDEVTYVTNYPASYSSQEYEILEIDIAQNGAAVVIAKATLKGTEGQEAYITTYTSSSTFVKMEGRWQAINTHVSGVKEERFPMAPTN